MTALSDELSDIYSTIETGIYSLEGIEFHINKIVASSEFQLSPLSAGLIVVALIEQSIPVESKRGFWLWLMQKFDQVGLDLIESLTNFDKLMKLENLLNNTPKNNGEIVFTQLELDLDIDI